MNNPKPVQMQIVMPRSVIWFGIKIFLLIWAGILAMSFGAAIIIKPMGLH